MFKESGRELFFIYICACFMQNDNKYGIQTE